MTSHKRLLLIAEHLRQNTLPLCDVALLVEAEAERVGLIEARWTKMTDSIMVLKEAFEKMIPTLTGVVNTAEERQPKNIDGDTTND